MYTQCPECETAFRVTADVLKKAAGKVRCGGCGHAFNALPYLSETRPAARSRVAAEETLPELAPERMDEADESPPDADDSAPRPAMTAAQSAALLKTLEQLAGEDIRLEDTGAEWRLVGNDEANNDDGAFADGDLDPDFGTESVIEVEENVIQFSFGEASGRTSGGGEFEQDEAFADTHAHVDTSLFRGSVESRVDELLDDAPTPVDQFLADTPNDVDAVEVFTVGGEAEIDASDVFASPDSRPEDVLRFDDNTGLPDNFDFDATAPPPRPEPEPVPVANSEPPPPQSPVAFGEPEEWVDLLDEVEPHTRAAGGDEPAGAAVDSVFDIADDDAVEAASEELALEDTVAATADPGDDVESAIDAGATALAGEAEDAATVAADEAYLSEPEEEPTLGAMTLEEELAALPDYDDDDLYGEPDVEPVREQPREAGEADAAADDDLRAARAAGGRDKPTDERVQKRKDEPKDAPKDQPTDKAGDQPKTDQPERPAATSPPRADGRKRPAAPPAAAKHKIPDNTGELELELAQAQQRSDEDLEFDPTRTVVPPPTEEEQTVNMMIDADLMRLAITDDDGMASTIVLEGSSKQKPESKQRGGGARKTQPPAESLFETIIMEGAFARTAQEQERLAAEAEARSSSDRPSPAQVAAGQDKSPARSRRIQYGLIAGVVALVLLLAGLFFHQSRAELATVPAVGDAIAPIYRAVGAPIAPEWNVKGWRFEVTRGSTTDDTADAAGTLPDLTPGEEVLTIYSRLGNKSGEPLPYPLIGVALTDRFEEVIGSKVVEPAEYLAAGTSARAMVAPGETFDAVIAVAAPADRAAGFKLNVCYRTGGGDLRCAVEDFR